MLDKNRPYDWYGNTVSTLLERPEYMGHTVNFRSSKKSYRDKRVKNAPEDWLIFENTHEAIVDPETWQLAQQVKRTVRRTDTTGVANPSRVWCSVPTAGPRCTIIAESAKRPTAKNIPAISITALPTA